MLALEEREQQLLMQSAAELENQRWKNWSNLFKALAKSWSG